MKRLRLKPLLIGLAALLLIGGAIALPVVRELRQEAKDRALIEAVKCNDASQVVDLLNEEANANARDFPEDPRPLWRLCWDMIRGQRQNVSGAPKALQTAVHLDESSVALALLSHGATGVNDLADFQAVKETFFWSGEDGPLPLLLGAARNGDIEIVKVLLDHKANVNVTDTDSRSALLICLGEVPRLTTDLSRQDRPSVEAIRSRYLAMARLLVERGADVRLTSASEGYSALFVAAMKDLPDMVDILLAHGADPNVREAVAPRSPIDYAARNSDMRILRALLKHGASVNPANSFPPILEASGGAAVRLLLDRGADPNEQGGGFQDSEETPLILASRRNDLASVRLLLSRGARVNTHNDEGQTALICAAQYAGEDCVRTLLEFGAQIDARTRKDASLSGGSSTALMMAAIDGRDDNISVLLDHGAKVDLKDAGGQTALMMAAQNGNDAAVFNLLDAGANINQRSNDGTTALDNAIEEENTAVIALLKKHGARRGRSVN